MKTVNKFIKAPLSGNVIKVYGSGSYYFGIASGVIVVADDHDREREVVKIDRVDRVYDILECHFFLDESRIFTTNDRIV